MFLKNITKCINTNKKASDFLNSNMDIVENYGGKKIFLCLIQNTGNVYDDWIIKHNEHIHYYSEFDYATLSQSKNSCGESQYKIIFDKIKEVDYSDLEPGTIMRVFFIDNNTTNNDKTKHDLMHEIYLGAITTSDFEIKAEKIIITNERIYDSDSIKHYAEKFGFKLAEYVFYGKLKNIFDNINIIDNINDIDIINSINDINININDNKPFIKKSFLKLLKEHIKQATPGSDNLDLLEIILNTLKEYITLNKTINQIIIYNNETDEGFQVIDDNTDNDIKDDKNYINQIRLIALGITNKLKRPFKPNKFKDILNQISDEIKNLKDLPQNKNKISVLDDIQHQCRQLVIKQIRGNNNFLYIGRIDLPTKEFFKNIKEKLKTHDGGVICLLSRASLKSTLELREKILTELFSNFDNIKIITNNNFNLDEIMKKSPVNINTILCSSKKLNDFKNIMINFPDLKLQEIDTGLSKEFLLKNIDNDIIFKSNTPKEIHHLYKLINDYYKSNPLTSTINESIFYVQAENQHWRSPFQRLDEDNSNFTCEFIVAAFLKNKFSELDLEYNSNKIKGINLFDKNENDINKIINCNINLIKDTLEGMKKGHGIVGGKNINVGNTSSKKMSDYFKIAQSIKKELGKDFDKYVIHLGTKNTLLNSIRTSVRKEISINGHKWNPSDLLFLNGDGAQKISSILNEIKSKGACAIAELNNLCFSDDIFGISIKNHESYGGNISINSLNKLIKTSQKNGECILDVNHIKNNTPFNADINMDDFASKIETLYNELKDKKLKEIIDIKKVLQIIENKNTFYKRNILTILLFLNYLDENQQNINIEALFTNIYYLAASISNEYILCCKYYEAEPGKVKIINNGKSPVVVYERMIFNINTGILEIELAVDNDKKILELKNSNRSGPRFEIVR